MKKPSKEEELLFDLHLSTVNAEFAFEDIQNWVVGISNNEPEVEEPDVLELLSEWGKASSIHHYLNKLDESEREKILAVEPDMDYEDYRKRLTVVEGYIVGVDKTDTGLFESTINEQLTKRASQWRDHLKLFKDPEDLDDPADDFLTKLMEERDTLEYAKVGVHLVKSRFPHFKGVDIDSFAKHIAETDKIFKQLLGKRRQLVYWADPVFWWRHKPE